MIWPKCTHYLKKYMITQLTVTPTACSDHALHHYPENTTHFTNYFVIRTMHPHTQNNVMHPLACSSTLQNNVMHGDLSTSNVMLGLKHETNENSRLVAKVGDL